MSAGLPTELDFTTPEGRKATPERMNEAMSYIVARIKAVEAVTPAINNVVETLRTVGLDRLQEALAPVFLDAQALATELQAISDAWTDNDLPGEMEAAVLTVLRGGAPTEFDTLAKMGTAVAAYRAKYLGAKAAPPALDDNGQAVVVGALYYDTVLERMQVLGGSGWKDAGSVVNGVMERGSATATAAQTVFPVTGGYDPGNILVAVNGLLRAPADVTVTSGTNIVFPAGLTAGDKVSWTKFTAITLSNTYSKTQVDDLLDDMMSYAAAI